MWIANGGTVPSVIVLNASNGNVVINTPTPDSPNQLAFDGSNMWITLWSGYVARVRKSDFSVTSVFPVGANPENIAFDGLNMWIANGGQGTGNTVTKLRANDGALLGTYTVGTQPAGVAFDGANIWVTNFLSDFVSKL